MNSNDSHIEGKIRMTAQKTKVLAILGCSGTIVLGFLVVLLSAWIYLDYAFTPEITELKVSHSPNNKNKIIINKIGEFPDPTLKIQYGNRYIIKTKVPDNISVEWKNDDEADVILTRQGWEPDIEKVEFK